MEESYQKPRVYIPFDILSDAREWANGKNYRVKVVLRQVSSDENGASFELVDVNSLEPAESDSKRYIASEGGYIKL